MACMQIRGFGLAEKHFPADICYRKLPICLVKDAICFSFLSYQKNTKSTVFLFFFCISIFF